MRKDLHQSNHIVQWGIAVAITAAVAMAIIIYLMNFALLRNPAVAKDWYIRIFLFAIAAFFTLVICRKVIYFLARHLNQRYFKRFTPLKILGTFKESQAKHGNFSPKAEHAVLLIHGFTASPQKFYELTKYLEEVKLGYSAPQVLGFGLDTTALLQKVRYQDWFREVLESFDELQARAEQVSVVGHSMGALLAVFVAQHRKIKNLVLVSPALYFVKDDLKYHDILFKPVLGKLYSWIIPYMPKTMRLNRTTVCDVLNHDQAGKVFQYLSVPTSCVKEIFKMQEIVDLKKANYESLSLLYGTHDITVNNIELVDYLISNKITYDCYTFEHSAHDMFEDNQREEVCRTLLKVLNNNP